jgi:hypothetical protein
VKNTIHDRYLNVMNESMIRQFIISVLNEEFDFPTRKWVLLKNNDPRKSEIHDDVFDLIQSTYRDIGGHYNIKSSSDIYRNKYWLVQDTDADNHVDVAILAKDESGTKVTTVANDGSDDAVKAYKQKSVSLHTGESIDGVQNWWIEVSGKPAYALLNRGAPAIEDEDHVRHALTGDKIVWYGEHPDETAPELFKRYKGWYGRKFGDHMSTKIIVGKPK